MTSLPVREEKTSINSSVRVNITCTPRVELCRVCGSFKEIAEMFRIVYRKKDYYPEFVQVTSLSESDLKIVREILKRRHSSVLEFINTLWFVECSRVATHEIVRHRIASYWQESQRYCISVGFLLPRSLLKYSDIVKFLETSYEKYRELINLEKCRSFGEDAKQYIRYILPNATLARIFIQMNLRELAEVFLPLRMCRRAQAELRYIAIKMYLKITELFPELANFTGPRCIIYGRCPEFGFESPEEMRKCRVAGYIEAFQEHGTEDEISRLDEILAKLP